MLILFFDLFLLYYLAQFLHPRSAHLHFDLFPLASFSLSFHFFLGHFYFIFNSWHSHIIRKFALFLGFWLFIKKCYNKYNPNLQILSECSEKFALKNL